MKLPTISLNFFKKPVKKKRTFTTFGKRSSSASSSVAAVSRKAQRSSSSNLKTRKQSITYYAPSKSKFYPSEHFPSTQRLVRHRAAVVPATPHMQRSYSYEKQPTASTDIDIRLNDKSSFSALHSYIANQAYPCDNNYGDIILHQPPIWYVPPKSQSPQPTQQIGCQKINQSIVNVNNDDICSSSNQRIQNKFHSNIDSIDASSNKVYDNNYLKNANISTYFRECTMQDVSTQSMDTTAVSIINNSNIKCNPANGTELYTHQIRPNDNKLHSMYQSKSTIGLPIYSMTVPFKKKLDRRHRRKVRH